MAQLAEIPPSLQAALGNPPLARQGWESTIAPRYLGLFLWAVYFDQLGRRTLAIGGLHWSLLGVLAGALLCYQCLYYAPAMWARSTGKPLSVLASSTFGAIGSVWLTGVLFGMAQVVWMAVATDYAVDWTFKGLVSCHLLEPRNLSPMVPGSWRIESPVFLISTLAWLVAASLVGHYLVRVIAALMRIYPVFPALMLGLAMLWTLGGVSGFRATGVDPASGVLVRDGGTKAFLLMIQLIFGFFSTAGLASADWGAVTRTTRDVRLGGLVGVAFAGCIVATLALLTVAGALGRFPAPPGRSSPSEAGNYSVQVALMLGVGGRVAGAIFLVFAVGSLAPTCFSANVLGHRFEAIWPRVSRLRWTLLGTAVAWILIASKIASRLEAIFGILGAVFAPMAGALAADYARSRGTWAGPRRGVNLAGLVAWSFGLSVGLIPLLVETLGGTESLLYQPASVYAFLVSFLIYLLMATLGAEPPVVPIPEGVAAPDPA